MHVEVEDLPEDLVLMETDVPDDAGMTEVLFDRLPDDWNRPDRPAATPPALLLRRWSTDDADALRAAIDDDPGHLRRWLSWAVDEPVSLEATRARLASWIAAFEEGEERYAIVAAEAPERILGGARLGLRAGPGAHDAGWWVRASETGRGIARAAVTALLLEAFRREGVGRVVAECDVANTASAGFARAVGFADAGTCTGRYPDGRPRQLLRFDLSRGAFEDVQAPERPARREGVGP